MKVLKSILIDDDAMCRRSFEIFCEKHDAIQLIGVFDSAQRYLEQLQKEESSEQPDLLFLDVEMPELTGLELLDALPAPPLVIITSSKKEYAFDAFEYQVVDFLKKPVNYPRFSQAIDKALAQANQLQNAPKNNADCNEKDFFVKTDGRFIRLNIDDILYFESTGDYVTIKTTTASHTMLSTIKSVEEKLQHPNFIKVHRSYIVNKTKIVDIEENTLVIAKKVIPISRSQKAAFMSSLNLLS
jgi:DNA-binding LytR/AlgR family response regulator